MIRRCVRLRHGYQSVSSTGSCRRALSSTSRWKPLEELHNGKVETFRREAFAPSKPALLPRGQFRGLPAVRKWFTHHQGEAAADSLNQAYLGDFGDAIVPLEFTRSAHGPTSTAADNTFQRAEAPFQIFLEWTKCATAQTPERLYLAQASFTNLPKAMIGDLPTPDIVAKAGTGDIYDTNVWLSIAPTYTPLHRDPNPNLFVQLAGHKVVRMLPPDAGNQIFANVQKSLGRLGSASFRGEEMMKGKEKEILEAEVWNDAAARDHDMGEGYEAHVWGGDGLFIPKGWWHSIKGVDDGILGSVNWWFR